MRDNELNPVAKENQLEVSRDFESGIRLALIRLDGILEHFSLRNARDLSVNFTNYIDSMSEIADWSGAFLSGIYRVVEMVKTYADSDKSPAEVVNEIRAQLSSPEIQAPDKDLDDDEKDLRFSIVRRLALAYHPSAAIMSDLGEDEKNRRLDLFKNSISHAIQLDGPDGLAELIRIAKDEGLVE